jgi:hypothetical protein
VKQIQESLENGREEVMLAMLMEPREGGIQTQQAPCYSLYRFGIVGATYL